MDNSFITEFLQVIIKLKFTVLAEVLMRNGYTVTKVNEGMSPRPLKPLSKRRKEVNQIKNQL